MRSVRPALFLALIAGALFFAWRGAVVYETQTGWSPHAATLEQRIQLALREALPEGETPERAWNRALRTSLDPAVLPQPDLYLARSIAASLPSMAGRENLALAVLAEERGLSAIEADLRARPHWQRMRRLEQALEGRLAAEHAQGLEPPTLVFASDPVRRRYMRAERLYAPMLSGVETWFMSPGERTLRLDAIPGWAGRLDSPVELHGGTRGLIAEACALARERRREPGPCKTGFIAKPAPDPVRLTLAALAIAIEGGGIEGGEGAAAAARLLLAARSAGTLQPGMAAAIAGPVQGDRVAGAVLDELVELLEEAGAIYAQPARHEAELADAAMRGLAGDRAEELAGLAEDVSQLRGNVGTGQALRLLSYVGEPDDLAALNEIAAIAGPDTLALFHLKGERAPELFALTQDAPDRASGSARHWTVAALLTGLAFLLLLSARLGAMVEAARGGSSGVRRLAFRMESLILGKNI